MFHVDWVTCIVPLFHTSHIHGGVRARFEDTKKYELDYRILERLQMEGSASSKISIRTLDAFDFFTASKDEPVRDTLLRFSPFLHDDYLYPMVAGDASEFTDCTLLEYYRQNYMFIEVSGNLIKYFQGHSIYGSMNHCGLIVDFCVSVLREFGIQPMAADIALWRKGYFYPKEIHVCANYRLSDYKEVDRFIHGMVKTCSLNHRGFRFDHNEKPEGWTAVHKTKGQLFRLSAYNKYCDLRDHKTARPGFDDEVLNERLIEHANGIIRFETKLKSRWFRSRNIMTMLDLYKLYPDLSFILNDQLQAIQTGGGNMKIDKLEKLKSELPTWVLPTFLFWFEGWTVPAIKESLGGGSRNRSGDQKYQRAAKYLREVHNINTKVRRTDADGQVSTGEVIPMIRTLEATPAEPPQWMIDEGLIYQPSEHLLKPRAVK